MKKRFKLVREKLISPHIELCSDSICFMFSGGGYKYVKPWEFAINESINVLSSVMESQLCKKEVHALHLFAKRMDYWFVSVYLMSTTSSV